jgi:hypothetical protein
VLVGVSADGQFIGVSPAVAVAVACDNARVRTRVAGDGEASERDDNAQHNTRDRKGVEESPPVAAERGQQGATTAQRPNVASATRRLSQGWVFCHAQTLPVTLDTVPPCNFDPVRRWVQIQQLRPRLNAKSNITQVAAARGMREIRTMLVNSLMRLNQRRSGVAGRP